MSDITTTQPAIRNGVDTATLFATIDAIKSDPQLAQFQFRASNRWIAVCTASRQSTGNFGQHDLHGRQHPQQEAH